MGKIYLISGHHNADPGAIGNGFKEADLTKELRGLIYCAIRKHDKGVEVLLDYDNDTLSQVIAKVKETATSNDVLLDIHFNAFSKPSATGTETLVANNARSFSVTLAKRISKAGAQVLEIHDRGYKTESQSHRGKLGILHTAASSVLWEVTFITNPDDMKKYQAKKQVLADHIARILVEAVSC